MRNALLALFLLIAPMAARAAFLDCVFFDGFQSPGSLSGSAISAADARAGLEVHNCARKTVDPAPATPIPLLTWNSTVAAKAQEWADQCNYAHGDHDGYGQNIYAGTGFVPTLIDASLLWADEEPYFDYTSNSCIGGQCGHYTQMVWRSTAQIGCGQATCTGGTPPAKFSPNTSWNIIVCDYNPPGNYIGHKPY